MPAQSVAQNILKLKAKIFDQVLVAVIYFGLGCMTILRPEGTILASIVDTTQGIVTDKILIALFFSCFGLLFRFSSVKLILFAILFLPLVTLVSVSFYFSLVNPTASFVVTFPAIALLAAITNSSFYQKAS